MKNSTRFCILTLVLSMLLAFVIFTLSAGGILVLDTSSRIFGLLIAFSCVLLSALLLGSLSAARKALRGTVKIILPYRLPAVNSENHCFIPVCYSSALLNRSCKNPFEIACCDGIFALLKFQDA